MNNTDKFNVAVVSGASSGIGRAVSGLLLENGFVVFGGGRCFKTEDMGDKGFFGKYGGAFIPVISDFTKQGAVEDFVKTVKNKCREMSCKVNVLINCAGAAFYGLHENLDASKIHTMAAVNIEAPMLLTALFLKDIRENKGSIVNVSSVTAKSTANTYGCAYGATKAALTSFGTSLFEEVRKHGVKVCNIHPDLTDTELYRNADFTASGEAMSSLAADEVANVVLECIASREGMVFTDITVRPNINKIVKKQVK